MSELSKQRLQEAIEQGKHIREVKSFVLREGRLTKGQQQALDDHWPTHGLDYKNEMLDLEQVFGRSAPVVLEIGFGMGHSLVEMAQNAADHDFIGVEVHAPGVGACLKTAADAKVDNLRVYRHDAVEVLANCIPDNALSRIQLFFPDPWHKKRHHKRRIVQPKFVNEITNKLKVGGVFHMATDWENYAEHMLEVMTANDSYTNQSATNDYVPRPDHRPLTKFENRGVNLGHGVWDLMFERVK